MHKPKPAAKPGPKSYTESETSENVDDEIMAELEELMGPATTEGGSPIGMPKSGWLDEFYASLEYIDRNKAAPKRVCT